MQPRAVTLSRADRVELEALAAWTDGPERLRRRARIVLALADGAPAQQVALAVGTSPRTVRHWKGRWTEHGIGGLWDAPRSGRPRTVDHTAVLAASSSPPPGGLPWTTRTLAAHLGVSGATIARACRDAGLTLRHSPVTAHPEPTPQHRQPSVHPLEHLAATAAATAAGHTVGLTLDGLATAARLACLVVSALRE